MVVGMMRAKLRVRVIPSNLVILARYDWLSNWEFLIYHVWMLFIVWNAKFEVFFFFSFWCCETHWHCKWNMSVLSSNTNRLCLDFLCLVEIKKARLIIVWNKIFCWDFPCLFSKSFSFVSYLFSSIQHDPWLQILTVYCCFCFSFIVYGFYLCFTVYLFVMSYLVCMETSNMHSG